MIDFSGYTAKAIEKAMLGRVSNSLDKREGSLIQTAIGPAARLWITRHWNAVSCGKAPRWQ